MDYRRIIDDTRALLAENPEWRERYIGYAGRIGGNAETIKANRERFRQWRPLLLYMNTTGAMGAKNAAAFELRYLGQSVARLQSGQGGARLSTKGFNRTNARDFGCFLRLDGAAWDGAEARAFRSHFKNRPPMRDTASGKGNEEHRLESLLLTEFSKTTDKKLRGIRPVSFCGVRYPMPTPLGASDHGNVRYSGAHGGGIDILARAGAGGRNTRLCVMELKDENLKTEPAAAALEQAVAYTVFVRELLRSEAGAAWYRLFGFGGEIPRRLVLYAACVMPDADAADVSFAGDEYDIGGDIIRLHYVYFKEIGNVIEGVRSSL